MRVLDLFSGLNGWSAPMRERGHEVVTLDNDPSFGADITADILEWSPAELPWAPDLILASPPCELFSTAGWHQHAWAMSGDKRNGTARYEAVKPQAHLAASLVRRTVEVIEELEPALAVIENPRALLRQLGLIPSPLFERTTIWYCHMGERRAKPTDLWLYGKAKLFPEHTPCHNQRASHPPDCCCRDHLPAPRGSVTGTQGMGTAESAKVPEMLALEVCALAEAVAGVFV